MAELDPLAYKDELWLSYCGREELLGGLDDIALEDQGDDFDGDALPDPAPPPDRAPPTAELAAVIADQAREERRRGDIVRALQAGDTDGVLRLARPEVLSDPERLAHVIELAARLLPPPPPPPEREFQVAFTPHPDSPLVVLAGPDGKVSHGPQLAGSTGATPLEALHRAFTQKGRLLALMAHWVAEGGNLAGSLSFNWNARMRAVESEIEYLGRLLRLDSYQLHQLDLHFEAKARAQLRAANEAREQAGHPGPGKVHADMPVDVLGRPRPWRPPFETPEAGWSPGADPPGKAPARPRRGRQRRARAYRKSAIMARAAR